MKYDTKASGKRLQRLRQEMNLSQEQLCRKTECQPEHDRQDRLRMPIFTDDRGGLLVTEKDAGMPSKGQKRAYGGWTYWVYYVG